MRIEKEFTYNLQSEGNCKVVLIQPDDLEMVWDEVVPLIEAALKYSEGEVIPEDLVQPIKTGKMQLWVAMSGGVIAAMITEIVVYPSCLLYTSPSPRDRQKSRMPSSA